MRIIQEEAALRHFISEQRASGVRIGFVPTMGALHPGHISLVTKSREQTGLTVCSIFINPTQFNDPEDFRQYPVSVEADIAMLEAVACDVLFLPSVREMYPEGPANMPSFAFGYLETILEGAHRPGHFKGVGQVVNRLLDLVQPDTLFLGQKDYQQCAVISELLKQTQRDNLELVICPTYREPDGLAMSSRNRRLTDPQRAVAGVIYQCLVSILTKKDHADFLVVQKECWNLLQEKGFEPEYVALANAKSLDILNRYDGMQPMVALIAARLGEVRLIDNMLLQ